MYLKLALRNAKRSIFDYILYIFSMVILTSIIYLSTSIANWGDVQAGFQTMALPLLIVIIMVMLVNYINVFIVKQRAKEFATYMLLGMRKDILSWVFLSELLVIGLICFILGVALGVVVFCAFCYTMLQGAWHQSMFQIILKSILQTFAYFCCVEILSILFMKQKIYKLQIVQLMNEKRRNQPLEASKRTFWGWMCMANLFFYVILLLAISVMPNEIMSVSISFISLPMLICVFSFYKWLYAFIAFLRLSQTNTLYQGNRLYQIAEMTTGSKSNANMNTIFCVCLIFSASSFTFGMLLINANVHIYEWAKQQWMGFLQIGICIIFMIIYFFTISLLQIVDLRKAAKNIRLLFQIGKNRSELKSLLYSQTLIRLFLPTLMAFVILLLATPFINYKLNLIFSASLSLHNLIAKAIGGFIICFFILYVCYFCVICMINRRYIKFNVK